MNAGGVASNIFAKLSLLLKFVKFDDHLIAKVNLKKRGVFHRIRNAMEQFLLNCTSIALGNIFRKRCLVLT